MSVYYIALIISFVITYLFKQKNLITTKQKLMAAFFSALPLIIISGFRFNVGTDYSNYYNTYWSIPGGYSEIKDPLYVLLVNLLNRLETGPIYIFVVLSAIFFIPIYYQIFCDSPYPLISIFLLYGCRYFFAYLNISRQLAACAILVFSIRYIEKDNFISFLLCIIIASSLHLTSMAFILVYFVRKIKLDIPSTIVLTIAIYVFGELISTLIRNILPIYGNYLNSINRTGTGLRNIIMQLFLYIFSYIFSDKSRKYNVYLNCQLITIISVVLSQYINLFERMRYDFCLSNIILLPLAINNIKDKKLKYLSIFLLIVFFTWYMYQGTIVIDMYNVIPYKWYGIKLI